MSVTSSATPADQMEAAVFLGISMGVSRTEFTFNTGILFLGFFYALITTAIGYIFYYEGLKHITKAVKFRSLLPWKSLLPV